MKCLFLGWRTKFLRGIALYGRRRGRSVRDCGWRCCATQSAVRAPIWVFVSSGWPWMICCQLLTPDRPPLCVLGHRSLARALLR